MKAVPSTPRSPSLTASQLSGGILEADRASLARALTLLESSRDQDKALAYDVLAQCQHRAGNAVRIAITGAPGVGKSTLINTLGQRLLGDGRRLAVLATDPTSIRSGGSILGDKTRMPDVANHPHAFIRPSPSSGTLGGMTRFARQSITLCEAAGYDSIFLETVGVGQSEVAVRGMADVVVLLVLAQAGDELQAVKRGILEASDVIAVVKADGEGVAPAKAAQRQYQRSLRLFPKGPSGIQTRVVTCSALTGDGIDQVWKAITTYVEETQSSGYFQKHRTAQLREEVRMAAAEALRADFFASAAVTTRLETLQDQVARGEQSTWAAAEELIRAYKNT